MLLSTADVENNVTQLRPLLLQVIYLCLLLYGCSVPSLIAVL